TQTTQPHTRTCPSYTHTRADTHIDTYTQTNTHTHTHAHTHTPTPHTNIHTQTHTSKTHNNTHAHTPTPTSTHTHTQPSYQASTLPLPCNAVVVPSFMTTAGRVMVTGFIGDGIGRHCF